MRCWELLVILLSLAGTGSGANLGMSRSKSRASFADTIGGAASGMGSAIGSFFGGSSGNPAQPEGNSGTTSSQPDAMYLIVKVDLVSSGPVTTSALNQPLLKEVEQMLAGFLKGTFHLTWVAYKEDK